MSHFPALLKGDPAGKNQQDPRRQTLKGRDSWVPSRAIWGSVAAAWVLSLPRPPDSCPLQEQEEVV